jgi:hypothetical protein
LTSTDGSKRCFDVGGFGHAAAIGFIDALFVAAAAVVVVGGGVDEAIAAAASAACLSASRVLALE